MVMSWGEFKSVKQGFTLIYFSLQNSHGHLTQVDTHGYVGKVDGNICCTLHAGFG